MGLRLNKLAVLGGLINLLVVVDAMAGDKAGPLVIGETFTVESKILGETRRINVYLPPDYGQAADVRLPVLYMPDGGISEDFLHMAGLVQVSSGNRTIRPCLLVGIENTQRRRDLTGPTEVADDRKIAKVVGGSESFRKFLRLELMPDIRQRYRTTGETAVIGESLAGLFVVETFLLEPDLFDTYIAIDPSLWWNDHNLVRQAGDLLKAQPRTRKTLALASSDEKTIAGLSQTLADTLDRESPTGLNWRYYKFPEESHATIFHPAALKACRSVFKP
jgi:predicted alpha/beta superfamily hydrolase